MVKEGKFYVTTPIYYVNDVPHIGHAYTTIIADVLARWHKLLGKEVFFLTGTDEHGAKIQHIAKEKKKKPKQFVDGIVKEFQKAWKVLNIDYDSFIRTTDAKHEKAVSKVLQEFYDKKIIYKGKYESHYCEGCEQYKTPGELVDGLCPDHKTEPEFRSDEAYLLKLSVFRDKLLKQIEKDKFMIEPVERKNEILSFLRNEELHDISISRLKEEVSWGVELPFDKNHTCYVWIDAFLNYLTGIGWPLVSYKKWWSPDVQLMSKDILRVHSTIWPYMASSLGLDLPKRLFIHGYFTVNGQKMSKSLKNVINPIDFVKKYGADAVRYYIMRAIPMGRDGDVSESNLKERYNNELANKLGNLVSRVGGMASRDGSIIKSNIAPELAEKLNLPLIQDYMEKMFLDRALNEIFMFVEACNEYVQKKQPWTLEGDERNDVLYTLLDSIRIISILVSPFVPEAAEKINKHFGFGKPLLKNCKFGLTKSGKIKKPEILFKKIE
ncbi:methionine--tRNA ligase [Nanoarchaeota archaeon]